MSWSDSGFIRITLRRITPRAVWRANGLDWSKIGGKEPGQDAVSAEFVRDEDDVGQQCR